MRYPMLAFFFVLVMPPFAVHALATGKARLVPAAVAVASHDVVEGPYFSRITIR